MDGNGVKRPIEFQGVVRAAQALLAIALAHGGFALAMLNDLPERIPIHFDAGGRPDGFGTSGFGDWFLLWFVSAGLGAFLVWISLRIDRFPARYLSIPRRDEIFALPEAARSRVMAVVSFHILVLTGFVMAFLFGLHVCIALIIKGTIKSLPTTVVLAGIALPISYTIVMFLKVSAAVNREIHSHVRAKDV